MHIQLGQQQVCDICSTPLSVHERAKGPICSALSCQTEDLMRQKRAANDVFEVRCASIVADLAEQRGASADITARVPFLKRPLVATPRDEKVAFRATLRASFRNTASAAQNGTGAAILEETPDKSTMVLNASCIACQGYCCRQGAGHAFLTPEYLPTVIGRNPSNAPAKIYREYVRHIPDQAYENSCIYHGERGCALPREMRSWVCNDFECNDRLRLKGDLERTPDASALIVAMDGTSIEATVVARPDESIEWLEAQDDQD